jgi:hypothetical protein
MAKRCPVLESCYIKGEFLGNQYFSWGYFISPFQGWEEVLWEIDHSTMDGVKNRQDNRIEKNPVHPLLNDGR